MLHLTISASRIIIYLLNTLFVPETVEWCHILIFQSVKQLYKLLIFLPPSSHHFILFRFLKMSFPTSDTY